jgi:predicted chitinase/chitodextrinase
MMKTSLLSVVIFVAACSSSSADSVEEQAAQALAAGCAAKPYAPGSYNAGDKVTVDGKAYECKPWPYSGWCSVGGPYAPGTGAHWGDAWTLLGSCSGGGNPPPPPPPPGNGGGKCGAAADWVQGKWYNVGDVVRLDGAYHIAVHENPGYHPTISHWFWDPYDCGGSSPPPPPPPPPGNGGSGLEKHLSKATFQSMFPSRNAFYTYEGLVEATKKYPAFGTTGSVDTQKREVAAFLANVNHETGGLVYVEEIAKGEYTDFNAAGCPPAPGKRYFGRGPIQLSWNYNYCAASRSIFGNQETLRTDPDRVARESWVAWATGIWFWMTSTGAGSSTAHDGIVGGSFGETIRTINGALECGGRNPAQVQSRIDAYRRFCQMLGVDPGGRLSC